MLFEEIEVANDVEDRIKLLRKELGLSANFEFHFSKNKRRLRINFLEAVARYNFFYFAIIIDKQGLYKPTFTTNESFYHYACGLLFQNMKPYIHKAIACLDRAGSKSFRLSLQKYLKSKLNEPKENKIYIKEIKMQDSKKNELIQLADMVCGSINRSIRYKYSQGLIQYPPNFLRTEKAIEKDYIYRKIIKHREIRVQKIP